ncbi:T9SS type A sorting domain-containing protein [Flavobacterium sp. MAH-1]|uniref:T9SS type A sorting domain-containing protein n=1 Tax=Flavobacterium agri TaxID=2743471 RepID=A0A7Y8Y474_9FLAO|nr:T9SS type A sorting domain-containing protein [Flavobacterium agri]NUY82269.1 T9SS type A sorting domain-containing protein [Flavobacterium agri]NYA72293.1 T9SS type A sorting domain-containing protein [Flavobacterium agri]
MKKNYLLAAGLLLFGLSVKSQILNQSAAWPNPSWSLTGSYSTDPLALESSPLTTANFAFDDDDAASGHEDNIAAESPIVDLTAAFNGGEKSIMVTVDYGYRYLDSDQLRLEYWDALASAWVAWGANIPGNNTTASDNYCTTITKTTYNSALLDLSNFTPVQLSGFRYRISYDDNPAGTDWNYGFCFNAPVIKSVACPTPQSLTATAITSSSATINWVAPSGATGFVYVLDTNSANPVSGTNISGTSYPASSLAAQTQYYFHIRSACSSTNSDWTTLAFTTAPANDNCSGSIALTVNPTLTCTATTAGTLVSASDSGVADTGAGTPDDDVWFRFVATSTSQAISLSGVAGTPTDLVHEVFSGDCAVLTSLLISDADNSVVSGLTIGNTYYVRVFTYATGGTPTTTFNICVATPPAPPANDNCSGSIALTVNPNYSCAVTTAGTLVSATNSGVADTGAGTPDDDVWFSFVATATTHVISLTGVAGSPSDLVHEVFSGNCGSLTSLLISDPNNSTVNGLTIGNTYYVRVFSYTAGSTNTTTFNICIGSAPAAPANDNCSGSVALTVNNDLSCAVTTAGTLAGATDSGVADTGAGTPDDDVWFRFVATSTAHIITLSGITGTPSDLVHEVFSGDCAVLTSLSISDPNSSTVTGLTVGNTYYVRVFSYASATASTTNFNICVGTTPAPPANDLCSSAIALTPGGVFADNAQTGTVAGATSTTGLTFNCQTNRADDVWYSVVVPASGSITIATEAAPGSALTDTVISVFGGSCGTLTEIGCSDDEGTDNFSMVSLTGQTPGATLYVGVWRWSSASAGTFQVSAYDASLSTGEIRNDGFSYYPNPVSSVFNVSAQNGIKSVSVYNMLGQEVLRKSIESEQGSIDMSSLAKGTYVVKVIGNDALRTIKIVKE